MTDEAPRSEIILYNTEDGKTRLQVRLEKETVWLTQAQMADLFQTTKQNVSLHIQNCFAEGELQRAATVKESLTVQQEGARSVQRRIGFNNLVKRRRLRIRLWLLPAGRGPRPVRRHGSALQNAGPMPGANMSRHSQSVAPSMFAFRGVNCHAAFLLLGGKAVTPLQSPCVIVTL